MKLIYSLLSLLFLPFISFAQNEIRYSYDAAGNRIKREIVMSAPKAQANRQGIFPEDRMFSDKLQDHPVRIYPNSTESSLKICISGLKDTDKCSYAVYNAQGALTVRGEIKNDVADIDISNNPIGVYLLRITVNNIPTTWKITKK